MMPSRYISSISETFQRFSQNILPQLRERLDGISSGLDVLIEGNRLLNLILPARLLDAAGSIERDLGQNILQLELKAKAIGDKIQRLECEFCKGLRGMCWFASILTIQILTYVGLLFGLNEPEVGLHTIELEFKYLEDDVMDLVEATEELLQGISALQQSIDELHAQVLRLAMAGSLTLRVQRSLECDSRGRD